MGLNDLSAPRGSHNSFGIPVDPSSMDMQDIGEAAVDVAFLDMYANKSWEVSRH